MLKSLSLVVVFSSLLSVFSPHAKAADKIILKYGMWRESIAISDLSSFCQTGNTTKTLDYYLRTSRQKKGDIQNTLCRALPIDGVILSDALNHPLGNLVLGFFGEIITTPSERGSKESLRGALVTSALKNDNLSIIEILENYPTSEVHLNGDRLMEMYQKIEPVLTTISKLK